VSPLAIVPLTVLASAVGWAHPGYAETAIYIGVSSGASVRCRHRARRVLETALLHGERRRALVDRDTGTATELINCQ
jgi:hypothetical protein